MDRWPLTVTAPSRLHFGLIAFGEGHTVQFGGVGLMLDRPATQLQLSTHPRCRLFVNDTHRVQEAASQWLALRGKLLSECVASVDRLPVFIRQLACPPPHVGLGSGTQLALAVAMGLDRLFGVVPPLTPRDATLLGRAKRSAVGSHGFFLGGLIFERGKAAHDAIGALEARVELPLEWRVVLACPRHQTGPSGDTEDKLFGSLPPVLPADANAMRRIVDDSMLPLARSGDFSGFSRAVYDFGYRAGLSYGTLHDGPFRGPSVRRLVEFIRSLGVEGVGQSSWGPCVFALCQNSAEADSLLEQLAIRFSDDEYWFTSSPINRSGHAVSESSRSRITMEEPIPRS